MAVLIVLIDAVFVASSYSETVLQLLSL